MWVQLAGGVLIHGGLGLKIERNFTMTTVTDSPSKDSGQVSVLLLLYDIRVVRDVLFSCRLAVLGIVPQLHVGLLM